MTEPLERIQGVEVKGVDNFQLIIDSVEPGESLGVELSGPLARDLKSAVKDVSGQARLVIEGPGPVSNTRPAFRNIEGAHVVGGGRVGLTTVPLTITNGSTGAQMTRIRVRLLPERELSVYIPGSPEIKAASPVAPKRRAALQREAELEAREDERRIKEEVEKEVGDAMRELKRELKDL